MREEIYATFRKVDFARKCQVKPIGGVACKKDAHYLPQTNGKGQWLQGCHRYFCEEHALQYYKDLVSSYKKKLFPVPTG